MDSSGFSSPRSDCFPAGLRVLVVDDDPTWLKILEKMLKKCNYEVTTCNLARDALNLLRERKDGFDIVISDVNMPDMDGFKLLEHVGLEMDLPVIMMSVDGETSRVMKGVQHGACDYLLKPIRMKELRNIWQHVFRKRMHGIRDIDGLEEIHNMMTTRHGNSNEQPEDFYLFARDMVSSSSSGKRRKDDNSNNQEDNSHSAKKARVVWTVDLHQKFVKAVNQIGFEKAGPKKILDLMGVPWLTRENVASHLQKYRLYLTRLQKENELKAATFGGIKHSDFSSMDSNGGAPVLQNKSIENITTTSNGRVVLPILVAEPEKSLVRDKLSSLQYSTGPLSSSLESEPAKIQLPYPVQKLDHEPKPFIQTQDHRFDNEEADKQIQVVRFDPCSGNSMSQGLIESKPTTKVETTASLFSVQPESHACGDFHAAQEEIPCTVWNSRSHGNLFSDVKPSHGSLTVEETETGSAALRLWNEEFDAYSSQQMGFYPNIADLGNMEPMGNYSNQELFTTTENMLYPTSWSLDCDYSTETVEYPIMDQGLFIA